MKRLLVTFEILDVALMFLRRGKAVERSEIAALAGLGVFLAGIETVFAGSQFADHGPDLPFLAFP